MRAHKIKKIKIIKVFIKERKVHSYIHTRKLDSKQFRFPYAF